MGKTIVARNLSENHKQRTIKLVSPVAYDRKFEHFRSQATGLTSDNTVFWIDS